MIKIDTIYLLLACLTCGCVCRPQAASAADCGTPPRSIRYSDNFYKAQTRLFEAARSHAASASAFVPAEIPIQIGASEAAESSSRDWQSLTVANAVSFVQEEIKNHRAAVIAECGYQLCVNGQASTDANFAKIEALGSLCRLAMEDGSGAGADFATLAAYPSYRMVVFRAKETTRIVRARLVNTTAGTLTVTTPLVLDPEKGELDQMPVVYRGSRKIVIRPHGYAEVKFEVRRPDSGDGVVRAEPMVFSVDGGVSAFAEFKFSLVPSFEHLLPTPSIGCGRINPHARVKCTSDARNEHPDKSAGHDDWVSLPTKGGPVVDYSANGRTWGFADYQASCNEIAPTQSGATTTLNFDASVGGVCGRNGTNAGGEGGVMPDWASTLYLPGTTGKHRWQVLVSVDGTRPGGNGTCSIVVNGESASVLFGAVTAKVFDLEPGQHEVRVTCSGENPWRGCYGANEGTRAETPFRLTASIKATRKRPTTTSLSGETASR